MSIKLSTISQIRAELEARLNEAKLERNKQCTLKETYIEEHRYTDAIEVLHEINHQERLTKLFQNLLTLIIEE